MTKKYKNNRSAQMARQIQRHREANLPRLNKLKELVGCQVCGKCDVPGAFLDGHHVYGDKSKFKSLAHLINRRWRRVTREIFGLHRHLPNGGGPIEFTCQRYHEQRHRWGDQTPLCPELEKKGICEPYRIPQRGPGKGAASRAKQKKSSNKNKDQNQ